MQFNRQALATSTSFIEIRNLDSSFRRESHRGRQVSREDAKIAKKSKTGMILF
jgi:hypothetical protein